MELSGGSRARVKSGSYFRPIPKQDINDYASCFGTTGLPLYIVN